MGRKRRPEHLPPREYDDPAPAEYVAGTCGAEYDTPNGDAWTSAGYGIGTCSKGAGHRGRHRAPVVWGDGRHGDEKAGEVTWE